MYKHLSSDTLAEPVCGLHCTFIWHGCQCSSARFKSRSVCRQVWNAADSEDEVLAVVVRTGLNTCMGSMIRQFIAPPYEYVAKDPFVKVTRACPVFKAA